MQSTVGQFSLELVEHGEKSHVRTDQGKEADSDRKKSAHKDAAGESWGNTSAWIQTGRPERSWWTHWTSSHTPCGSFTHSIAHIIPRPPCSLGCEWRPTWTKWRRKMCQDQMEYLIPEAGWQGERRTYKSLQSSRKAGSQAVSAHRRGTRWCNKAIYFSRKKATA